MLAIVTVLTFVVQSYMLNVTFICFMFYILYVSMFFLFSGNKRGAKYSHGRSPGAVTTPAGPTVSSGLPPVTPDERFKIQQDLAALQAQYDVLRSQIEDRQKQIHEDEQMEAEEFLVKDPKGRGKYFVTFDVISL